MDREEGTVEDVNQKNSLQMLCRVCAVLLTGYKYEVSKHLDVLQKIFVVDFTKDVADVHPPYICLKCYACIGHFTLKDVLPTKTVSTW